MRKQLEYLSDRVKAIKVIGNTQKTHDYVKSSTGIKKINQDNKKINTKSVLKIAAITFCILAVILLITMLTTKVDIETEGWCNSGYIGLDIEAYNNIQNKTCTKIEWDNETQSFEPKPVKDLENITCFKKDFQLKHVKLKDIDGLNCQGKAKIKMPFILSLFMGGLSE